MAQLPAKKAFPKEPIEYDRIWACTTTERCAKLRKEWEEAPVEIVSDDSVSFTKGYNKNPGLPIPYRFAEGAASILDNCQLLIRDGELIVGQMNGKVRGVDIFAAECPQGVLDNIARGAFDRKYSSTVGSYCSPEDMEILKKEAEYWVQFATKPEEDEVNVALKALLGEGHMDLMMDRSMLLEGIPFRADPEESIWGRLMPEKIGRGRSSYRFEPAAIGLKKVKELCQQELDRMVKYGGYMNQYPDSILSRVTPLDKKMMLKGMIIACDSIIRWANRYADLAEKMAKEETRPERKAELEKIASNCRWVPENPPRDFWEALQAVRFMHAASQKEKTMRKETALNRMDLDLYPYYIADKKAGRITPEKAVELFCCFLIKTREVETWDPESKEMAHSQGTLLPDITICGKDEDGNDCTNEMSCIILRAMANMKFSEPTIYIRVNDKMDDDFLKFAVKANMQHKGGCPAFLNDKLGTEKWLEYGIPLPYATDWQTSGCLGYHLNIGQHIGGFKAVNLIKCLELALHDGFDPHYGKQLGPHTGKFVDMKSAEELEEAYYKQVDYFAEQLTRDYEIRHSVEMKSPLMSPLNCVMYYDSAIEYGVNPTCGGTPYPMLTSMWVGERGTTDVADALAGLKKVVFDDKVCTTEELYKAIQANWEGYETIHEACKHAPKYGNDDEYVDSIFKRVADNTKVILQKRPDPLTGTKPLLFKGAASAHLVYGTVVGALPGGRVAGTPINDGGVSAMAGGDTNGPTALLNSAAKFDSSVYMGNVLNVKLNSQVLNSEEKLVNIVALIKAYIQKGGFHVQINIHDQEELIDARHNPDKHRDLLVRVGGYSANFVDLPFALQDEISNRTCHTL